MAPINLFRTFLGKFISESLYRNSIYLMLNNLATSALGFIFWIVVARHYSESDIGIAAVIISSMTLLSLISMLGFEIGIIRFLPSASPKGQVKIMNSCLMLSCLVSLLVTVIFFFGIFIWAPDLSIVGDDIIFFTLLATSVLLQIVSVTINSVYIARRIAKYAFIKDSLIFSTLKIIFPVFLISFGAFGIFSSWILATLLAIIVSVIIYIPKALPGYKPSIKIGRGTIKRIIRFSFGNYIGQLFRMSPGLILPLIIINLLTPADAGYFYICWMFARLLFMIPGTIASSFLVESSTDSKTTRSNLYKALSFTLGITVPLSIVFYFLGGHILEFMGTEYANNGFLLLQIFAASTLIYVFNTFYVTLKRIEKDVTWIIITYGLMSVFTIGISYFLIPDIGIVGIGIAWTISQIIALFVAGAETLLNRK